jgi:hypothetical protein
MVEDITEFVAKVLSAVIDVGAVVLGNITDLVAVVL